MARILIAVDMSEASNKTLEAGGSLAQDLGAEVVLVHAFEPVPRVPVDLSLAGDYEDFLGIQAKSSQEQALTLTTEMANDLRSRGLKVEVVAKDGSPDDVILTAADEHDVQLIVVGSHGRKGIRLFVLGSITQTLLQRTKRPLVVIPVGKG